MSRSFGEANVVRLTWGGKKIGIKLTENYVMWPAVVVMLQGEIVEQGPKTNMFSPPHHEYTELLLSSVPEMDPDWLNELIMHREKHGVMASTSTS